MNKNEKLSATIAGKDIGVVPYSFWSHFPGIDLDPVALAHHTYDFYRTYDVDFIKTAPNGMFSVEDFGCVCDYSDIKRGGVAKVVHFPVNVVSDWSKISIVDCESGALGRELRSLRLLLNLIDGEAPVVVIAFSPLTTAVKLSNKKIFEHIREEDNRKVHSALSAIAETTARFIEKSIDAGAAGVFFATQVTNLNLMSKTHFNEFGVRYDLEALSGASKGWFNVVHIHGKDIMFDVFRDYPVQVVNWHVWETIPRIFEARSICTKCFMGGINRMDITNGNKEQLAEQIRISVEESGGKRLILTPGCTIRYPLNDDVLKFVKDEIEFINNSRR